MKIKLILCKNQSWRAYCKITAHMEGSTLDESLEKMMHLLAATGELSDSAQFQPSEHIYTDCLLPAAYSQCPQWHRNSIYLVVPVPVGTGALGPPSSLPSWVVTIHLGAALGLALGVGASRTPSWHHFPFTSSQCTPSTHSPLLLPRFGAVRSGRLHSQPGIRRVRAASLHMLGRPSCAGRPCGSLHSILGTCSSGDVFACWLVHAVQCSVSFYLTAAAAACSDQTQRAVQLGSRNGSRNLHQPCYPPLCSSQSRKRWNEEVATGRWKIEKAWWSSSGRCKRLWNIIKIVCMISESETSPNGRVLFLLLLVHSDMYINS